MSNADYANHFDLRSYVDAMTNCRVLNISELTEHIWLRLPSGQSTQLTLSKIAEISIDSDSAIVDYTDHINQDTSRTWLTVDTEILNTSIGFHMYSLTFTNNVLKTDCCFYFCYKIQSNTPDRPYIYMSREEN